MGFNGDTLSFGTGSVFVLLLLHLLHSFIIRRIPNNTIKVEKMERLYETKELMKQMKRHEAH